MKRTIKNLWIFLYMCWVLNRQFQPLHIRYNLIHGWLIQLTNYVIHLEKKVVTLENEKNKNSRKLHTKCKFSDKGFCKKRQVHWNWQMWTLQNLPIQTSQKNATLDTNVVDDGLTASTFTVMMKKGKRLKPMMTMMET